MKETLFEMLLTLFETSLNRLTELNPPDNQHMPAAHEKKPDMTAHPLVRHEKPLHDLYQVLLLKEASSDSMRIYSLSEQMKLSKASYQFLMQLNSWGIISRDVMELIIHRLLLSDSHIVSLQETKWIIRSLLGDNLAFDQLAYLDLVLYHKEDAIVRH
jgi:Smg protein